MSGPALFKVVVVDDSSHIPLLVAKALKGTEFELVAAAQNGEEGIKTIEDHQPRVVLLDMLMPKLDGIDVLRRLRDTWSQTSFVIVSSSRVREDVLNCKKAGADAYVLKPFKLAHLLATLRRLTGDIQETA